MIPAPSRAGPDVALQRVRRSFPRLGRRLAIGLGVLLVLLAWLAFWLGHHHLAASLEYGLFEGRVYWTIDQTNWRDGGETIVLLRQRFYLPRGSLSASVIVKGPLDRLTDLHRVVVLDLAENPGLTDRDFQVLGRLPELRELDLTRSYEWIPRSDYLHHIGAVLPLIKGHPALRELRLAGTDLTDRDLETLAAIPGLTMLDLSDTEITDAGLAHLDRLPNLETLIIEETRVSKAAVVALARRRPLLVIHHRPRTVDKRPR